MNLIYLYIYSDLFFYISAICGSLFFLPPRLLSLSLSTRGPAALFVHEFNRSSEAHVVVVVDAFSHSLIPIYSRNLRLSFVYNDIS